MQILSCNYGLVRMLKLEGTQLLLNFQGVIRARPPTCRERNETKKLAGMHIYLLAGCCACALSSCAAKVVAVSNGNFKSHQSIGTL